MWNLSLPAEKSQKAIWVGVTRPKNTHSSRQIVFSEFFQGNTEEMKHASLAVSTIITVLALVKTALKSACTTLTSWLLRCID